MNNTLDLIKKIKEARLSPIIKSYITLFNNCNKVEYKQYPDSIFYTINDGVDDVILFELYKSVFYVSSDIFWMLHRYSGTLFSGKDIRLELLGENLKKNLRYINIDAKDSTIAKIDRLNIWYNIDSSLRHDRDLLSY